MTDARSRAGAFVADVLSTLGNLVAILFALSFMLRDGEAMARHVRDRLPLSADESERLMSETRRLVIFFGLVVGPIILVTTARLLEHLRHPDVTVHV